MEEDSGTLPSPPTVSFADLNGFHFMPLHVSRLLGSDLVSEATADEFRAAVLLWCASWHQIPAGSLPASDTALARLAQYGRDLQGFQHDKRGALRGWYLCSDGRLYHPIISGLANEAWEKSRRNSGNATKRWGGSKKSGGGQQGIEKQQDSECHRIDVAYANEVPSHSRGNAMDMDMDMEINNTPISPNEADIPASLFSNQTSQVESKSPPKGRTKTVKADKPNVMAIVSGPLPEGWGDLANERRKMRGMPALNDLGLRGSWDDFCIYARANAAKVKDAKAAWLNNVVLSWKQQDIPAIWLVGQGKPERKQDPRTVLDFTPASFNTAYDPKPPAEEPEYEPEPESEEIEDWTL